MSLILSSDGTKHKMVRQKKRPLHCFPAVCKVNMSAIQSVQQALCIATTINGLDTFSWCHIMHVFSFLVAFGHTMRGLGFHSFGVFTKAASRTQILSQELVALHGGACLLIGQSTVSHVSPGLASDT